MKDNKKIEQTQKMVDYDREVFAESGRFCGIDEAGRGPLAGPVVVASCIMPLDDDKILYGINDSKKLTEKAREELYEKIKQTAIDYSIQVVDENTIDEINILQATKLGMKNSVNCLREKPNLILVDAVKNLDCETRQKAIIKGDATSYSIAAASILAKVYRDKLMVELDKEYPQFNFAKHKGYGTTEHIKILKEIGPSKVHRKTFIKNFVEMK